jgi:CRISPR-associated endoribonuclease Cas6
MRFSIKLSLSKPEIPIYYRTALVSYMKKILEGTTYFDLYYKKKFPKPFTFAVYLPIKKIEENKILLKAGKNKQPFITWNVSFADTKLALTFTSEIYKKQKHRWRNEVEFSLIGIELLKEKLPPETEKVIFKTLSPVVVRGKDKKVIPPTAENFEEEFNKVQKKIFETLGFNYEPVRIKPKKCDNLNYFCIKKQVIKMIWSNTENKVVKIPSYDGIFELEGNSEILKMLYRKGLGEKTSDGFGMVEVIKGS